MTRSALSATTTAGRRHAASARVALLGLAVAAASACATERRDGVTDTATAGGEVAPESAGAVATAPSTGDSMMRPDTAAMAGHDMTAHAAGVKSADHEFLRMMSDHHVGLVRMADDVDDRLQASAARRDAEELGDKQESEQERMLTMIRQRFGESYAPKVMPGNQAQRHSLEALQGAPLDREFYRLVVAHHREGVQLIERYLPRLESRELRQMAERMRDEQRREIQEFERKMQQAGRS